MTSSQIFRPLTPSTLATLPVLTLAVLVGAVLGAGCGRSSLRGEPTPGMDGGISPTDVPFAPDVRGDVRFDVPAPRCGDGACTADERCETCPSDCGECGGCGDGTCDAAAGEDCTSCPGDCGACVTCGDGTCNMATETCTSCPMDCGSCVTCGDGACNMGETCTSCPGD